MIYDDDCKPLCQQVTQAMKAYFDQLDGQEVTNLHSLVISEVEKPLLKAVLEHTKSNQSKAAKILGISRGTLRKKIVEHQIDE